MKRSSRTVFPMGLPRLGGRSPNAFASSWGRRAAFRLQNGGAPGEKANGAGVRLAHSQFIPYGGCCKKVFSARMQRSFHPLAPFIYSLRWALRGERGEGVESWRGSPCPQGAWWVQAAEGWGLGGSWLSMSFGERWFQISPAIQLYVGLRR